MGTPVWVFQHACKGLPDQQVILLLVNWRSILWYGVEFVQHLTYGLQPNRFTRWESDLGGAEAPPLHPNPCAYVGVNLQVHPNVSKCPEMSTYLVDNLKLGAGSLVFHVKTILV